MIQYKILEGMSIPDIAHQTAEHLNAGWKKDGQLFVNIIGIQTFLCQPMRKGKLEETKNAC